MKLIHVALCASALSACAIAEDASEQLTNQERRGPTIEAELALDGNCSELNVFANWSQIQPDQSYIDYTIADLTSGSSFLYTSLVMPTDTTNNNQLDVLSPLATGHHRFLLVAELKDSADQVILRDRFRVRLPCSFDI